MNCCDNHQIDITFFSLFMLLKIDNAFVKIIFSALDSAIRHFCFHVNIQFRDTFAATDLDLSLKFCLYDDFFNK